MTQAIIRVKGDPSVGILDQWFHVDNLEFDDADHRKLTVRALQNCFALITGEHPKDIAVTFDDDFTPEEGLRIIENAMLTDTYLNEQRN